MLKKIAIKIALAALLGLFIYLLVIIFGTRSIDREWQPRIITVRRGASAGQIANMLHRDGVIEHPAMFKYLALAGGLNRRLKAGRYRFDYPLSAWEALDKIHSGAVVYHKVTIPEGLTLARIAGILANEAGADSQALIKAFRDTALMNFHGIKAASLEGYLFPETYDFEWGSSADLIARRLVESFFANIKPEWMDELKRQKRDLRQMVIMASLVEREAQVDAERPVVASVFYNRLKARRPLESCATVEYALPRHKNRRLTYDDLEIDSPYNTYRRQGLPPGPICNPGRRSLEAAAYPAQTNFLYFVSKGDGSHIFTRTLEEHNRAKRLVQELKDRR
ncbi:MAG: endolytic transglycosylase MltG [Candidatus Edwardsbacteria bacterium]|nr:endolytic transglycosylase MltG [Candidatus Edwardsbacteria bacterium]MBU1576337.1 endolytic transglycosylase MltG [Candidatus Edwardsbacteria bacterium]MBU2462890.1 endolytic transglycosylase MltG [Candidatus Edwardsbacteria bacterium]MBU2593949.1 endolytic transglycosylase MltG [Candidatus Edwardsbacteria bacterium]